MCVTRPAQACEPNMWSHENIDHSSLDSRGPCSRPRSCVCGMGESACVATRCAWRGHAMRASATTVRHSAVCGVMCWDGFSLVLVQSDVAQKHTVSTQRNTVHARTAQKPKTKQHNATSAHIQYTLRSTTREPMTVRSRCSNRNSPARRNSCNQDTQPAFFQSGHEGSGVRCSLHFGISASRQAP